jgi:phage shock protein A
MAYFNRLTDIVTCNLSSLLSRCENPEQSLEAIIAEMKEGVAGAERCVRTSIANVGRLEDEISEHRRSMGEWVLRAQENLRQNLEGSARECLQRKHEIEDLIAGLEQQLQAAVGTRDHLQTMLSALKARLSDGYRRLSELRGDPHLQEAALAEALPASVIGLCRDVTNRVDAELEELRRQLKQG